MNRFVWTPRPRLLDLVQAETAVAIPDNRFDQDNRGEMIATLLFVAVHRKLCREDVGCDVESIHPENLEFGFHGFTWHDQILWYAAHVRLSNFGQVEHDSGRSPRNGVVSQSIKLPHPVPLVRFPGRARDDVVGLHGQSHDGQFRCLGQG